MTDANFAEASYYCGLTWDNRITCWGTNQHGSVAVPGRL